MTKFLCDLIRMEQGQLTKAAMRKRWAAGEYEGVCPAWAKWNMEGK